MKMPLMRATLSLVDGREVLGLMADIVSLEMMR